MEPFTDKEILAEAARFQEEHAVMIEMTRSAVKDAIELVLDGFALVSDDFCKKVIADLDSRPTQAMESLRGLAISCNIECIDSAPIWHLVNACSFLYDATSTNWRYLQQSDRERLCKFAIENAQAAKRFVSSLPTESNNASLFSPT